MPGLRPRLTSAPAYGITTLKMKHRLLTEYQKPEQGLRPCYSLSFIQVPEQCYFPLPMSLFRRKMSSATAKHLLLSYLTIDFEEIVHQTAFKENLFSPHSQTSFSSQGLKKVREGENCSNNNNKKKRGGGDSFFLLLRSERETMAQEIQVTRHT